MPLEMIYKQLRPLEILSWVVFAVADKWKDLMV